jgi:hypothetical protein
MVDELAARVDAVKRFVAATQGEAAASARVATLRTVGDLQRAENELAAYRARLNTSPPSAQVTPPPVAAAAPQPQAGARVTEEQWQQMPAAERLDYCRHFPQSIDGGRR